MAKRGKKTPLRGAKGIRLTKAKSRRLKPLKGVEEYTLLHRDVEPDISDTMVCGIVRHLKRHKWTIRYDEYYYVLSGHLRITVGRKHYDMKKGDAIWLPANTPLIYDPRPRAKIGRAHV